MEFIVPIATLVVVVVLPFFVNLCTTEAISSNVKRWIVIVVSLLVGIATGVLSGFPTPETLVTWVLACLGGVQLSYSAFKSIGITNTWLEALQGIGTNGENEKQ